jgi:sulfite exporter TauE/SafE
VPTEVSFLTALMIGFLGSTHCIGMCGGIASIVTFNKSSFTNQLSLRTTLIRTFAYNLGRISSYMIAGLLAGVLGSTVIAASVLSRANPG